MICSNLIFAINMGAQFANQRIEIISGRHLETMTSIYKTTSTYWVTIADQLTGVKSPRLLQQQDKCTDTVSQTPGKHKSIATRPAWYSLCCAVSATAQRICAHLLLYKRLAEDQWRCRCINAVYTE
jgi:hypothetical protein